MESAGAGSSDWLASYAEHGDESLKKPDRQVGGCYDDLSR